MIIKIECEKRLSISEEELKSGLKKLFDVEFCDGENYDVSFSLKSKNGTEAWKDESLQTFSLKKIDDGRFEISGESDIATFYGVSELLSLYGVCHLLTEDVYPEEKKEFYLPDINRTFSPRAKIREWRVLADFLSGGEGRSLKEQLALVRQLARQKNNSIKLDVWLFPPFLNYSCTDPKSGKLIEKKGGKFHCAQKFEVRAGGVGAQFVKPTERFTNPDFAECKTDEEVSATAENYLKKIIEEAKKYDMRVALQFNPFDYPGVFEPMLEKPDFVQQIGETQVCEGGDICGEKSLFMIDLVFGTVASKYPQTDVFIVVAPEIARSAGGFEKAVDYLDGKFAVRSKFDLDAVLSRRDEACITPGGSERAYLEGKMNLQIIAALYEVLERSGIGKDLVSNGKKIGIACGATTPYLLPLYSSLLDEGVELYIGGYTCGHTAKVMHDYDDFDFSGKDVVQVLTLQDDNVGAIVQSQIGDFSDVFEFNVRHGIKAFSTRFWPTGDLEETSLAVSESCWSSCDAAKSFSSVLKKLFGKYSSEVNEYFTIIENCTKVINATDLCVAFQINGLIASTVGEKIYTPPACVCNSLVECMRALHVLEGVLKNDDLTGFPKARLEYIFARTELTVGILKQKLAIAHANHVFHEVDRQKGVEEFRSATDRFESVLKKYAKSLRYDNDLANLVIYEHICVNEVRDKLTDSLTKF